MTHRLPSRQRGLGFFGLLLLIVVLGGGGVLLARMVPSLVEYQAVIKAAKRAAGGSSVADARSLFDRTAAVENITSITGRDLEITNPGTDHMVVKFAYQREFPVAGPVFITLKLEGRAPSAAARRELPMPRSIRPSSSTSHSTSKVWRWASPSVATTR